MIFDIFKSKPTLKELIPNGSIDIHSHILPGIDDGSTNFKESKKLIDGYLSLGFKKIIATPHVYEGIYPNSSFTIKESFDSINTLSKKIKIDYAAEYMADSSLLKKIEEKSVLTLDQNHVLIEMSYFSFNSLIYDIIFLLRINNYIPVLAHPERYIYLNNNFKVFKKLKRQGCLFQLNMLSATGGYGRNVLKLSEKLVKEDMCDFIGSDIHNYRDIKGINKLKVKFKNAKAINKLKELFERTNKVFI